MLGWEMRSFGSRITKVQVRWTKKCVCVLELDSFTGMDPVVMELEGWAFQRPPPLALGMTSNTCCGVGILWDVDYFRKSLVLQAGSPKT